MDFDVAQVVEWDLLMLAPLEELYRDVAPDAVGSTAYTPLSQVGEEWEWLWRPELRTSTEQRFRRSG